MSKIKITWLRIVLSIKQWWMHSLVTADIEPHFIYLLAILIYSLIFTCSYPLPFSPFLDYIHLYKSEQNLSPFVYQK